MLPPPALLKRVSWGAIFAGAVIAVALTALLSLLGLGIGFGTLDPAQGDTLSEVPKNTLIWWAVISIIATGIGGFVAGRLAGIPRSMTGALHGLAVWSVATLVTLWLATTAVGAILGAATSVVTTTAKVATGAVTTAGGAIIDAGGAVAPSSGEVQSTLRDQGVTQQRIQREAEEILGSAGVTQGDVQTAQNAVGTAAQNIAMRPGSAQEEINRLISRLFEGPNAALSPAERDALVTELAQRAGMSRQQAEQVAARWESQAAAATRQVRTTGGNVVNQAGETAIQVSDDALDILSKAAWGMFLISLAGMVAAMMGAALSAPSVAAVAGSVRDDDHDHDHDRRH
jgi:hypothetical protein